MKAMSLPIYTEDDANYDCTLYFHEEIDLTSLSIISEQSKQLSAASSAVAGNTSNELSDMSASVDEAMSRHFSAMRFLEYANAVNEVENKRKRRDSWEIIDKTDEMVNNAVTYPDPNPSLTLSHSLPPATSSSSGKESEDIFPYVINVYDIQHTISHDKNDSFQRAKQLQKDIERDKLLINNESYIGAAIGLDGIKMRLSGIYEKLLLEQFIRLDVIYRILPEPVRDILSQAVLYKASRTHSGALVYQAIQNIVDSDRMMIIPQSAITPPLKIRVKLDKMPDCPFIAAALEAASSESSSAGRWGVVCQVVGEFVYRVQPRDTDTLATGDDGLEEPHQPIGPKSSLTPLQEALVASPLLTVIYEDFVFYEINLSSNNSVCQVHQEPQPIGAGGKGSVVNLIVDRKELWKYLVNEDYVTGKISIQPRDFASEEDI